ncbi:MAG TPA: MarC family protein [Opitutaceae bacterium]|nr:MarC family protein [Opitutaceae bacterium]
MEYAQKFLLCFIPLFVTIDPVGLAAIFLALGRDVPIDKRRRIAKQATWTGGIVALLFLFLGRSIFIAIGIGVSDFEIAGGLILFILASRELIQTPSQEKRSLPDDFGVVPLGMPLIAGPATITTLLVVSQSVGLGMTLLALAVNLGLVAIAFAQSERLERLVGQTGLRAVSKIIALLLAAIAVHIVRRGFTGP